MPQVTIPPPYRGPTRGEGSVDAPGGTVRACLEAVAQRYPGFGEQIFDARGAVHKFVTLFVNGDEIGRTELDRSVTESDEIEILAAIAGG